MTTYMFSPTGTSQLVDWSNTQVWPGGAVPNGANADVIFPTVTYVSTGQVYYSDVSIGFSETYSVNSISIANNYLIMDGSLNVSSALNIQRGGEIDMGGGLLSAGSIENDGFDIQGNGQINAGILTNQASIIGNGLTFNLAGLVNSGTLHAASGNLTLNVSPGGFSNLSGTTLTGGTYAAGYLGNQSTNILYLNVGGLIVTDAANIELDAGGEIVSGANVPLQSSLQSISSSGRLSLANQTYNWAPLTVDGVLALSGAIFNPSQLTVGTDGQISGSGKIIASIANAGIIIAENSLLDIDGAVTGSGGFEVGPGSATLELSVPISENVIFSNGSGKLELDNAANFTGSIGPAGSGDQIILNGVSLASITGHSYSGTASGGTLTLEDAGTTISLEFIGSYDLASFTYSAGPQLLSTSPPSLVIKVGTSLAAFPTVASISETLENSDPGVGAEVAITLTTSEPLIATGGFGATLSLNDGGIATYDVAASTRSSFVFDYTVGAGQNTPSLAVTAVNLNGVTVTDYAGNPVNLSLAGLIQAGPEINTVAPSITSVSKTPSTGDLGVGGEVAITLTTSEALIATGGFDTTLSLNDGGIATYDPAASTSSSFVFDYTVTAGQDTPSLAVTAVNMNGVTATDAAGNAVNLSLAGLPQTGPQIDTGEWTVSGTENIEIPGAFAETATFAPGAAGTLTLDHSTSFSGHIAGLTEQDTLDLKDIAFGSQSLLAYFGVSSPTATLDIGDGTHFATIALLGDYMGSSFVTTSDGHGGTLITDHSTISHPLLAQPNA